MPDSQQLPCLTSIITNLDQTKSERAQVEICYCLAYSRRAREEHKIPLRLFLELKKAIVKSDHKDIYEVNTFIDELPHKLKLETASHVHLRGQVHEFEVPTINLAT